MKGDCFFKLLWRYSALESTLFYNFSVLKFHFIFEKLQGFIKLAFQCEDHQHNDFMSIYHRKREAARTLGFSNSIHSTASHLQL